MKWFTLAFVGVYALVLGCSTQRAAQKNVVVQPIQVTVTWDDLLSQPAISLEKGTAHLGIETSCAPYRGGLLLYCLTEGYSLPQEWSEPSRLGPFTVEIRHDDDTEKAQAVCQIAWNEPPEISHSAALFRRTIPLDRPGRYHIKVFRLDGEPIAEASVTATREKYHPWMPLEPISGVDSVKGNNSNSADVVAYVRNRGKGIAIPRFEGMEPMLFGSEMERSLIKEKLPTIFPAENADGKNGLSLKTIGLDILIQSKENIIIARADWHFLVRWWVNGDPYIPEQMDSFTDHNGMVIIGRKLRLNLDFVPDRVGAKPGDQVEMQLLYCKNGWELVQDMEVMSAFHEMQGPELILSNRVRLEWENRQQNAPADTDKPRR